MAKQLPADLHAIPHARRRPQDDAFNAVAVLQVIANWYEGHPEYGVTDTAFLQTSLADAINDASINADTETRDLREGSVTRLEQPIHAAFACAVEALRLVRAGREAEAWSWVADMREWLTFVRVAHASPDVKGLMSIIGKLGADARHREDRDMKRMAIEAFQKGDFPSKDAAAKAIAGKIVPLRWRTVRDYLKDVSKKS
ncbi:MAG: hypothetical protein ACREPY_14710 [Rhodanobacteraceae bacterium]